MDKITVGQFADTLYKISGQTTVYQEFFGEVVRTVPHGGPYITIGEPLTERKIGHINWSGNTLFVTLLPERGPSDA